MNGTKTTPASNGSFAFSSSAFSPVAYSKMDNIMRYNNIQKRINQLTTIYENLKETTYNMDSTILNMWKNWVDDNDNKFNTYLINYTIDGHNEIMVERLQRIENLYNHIEQLEKERDLINIEEDNESEDEQETHPRLFGKESQNREELEKILHIKINEYNEINYYRNYLLYEILREREQFMTNDSVKNLEIHINELEIKLKGLMIPIREIRKKLDIIIKEEEEKEEEKNKKFEHLFKQKLYTRIEQIINENEEEEDEEYEQDFIDIETEDEEEDEEEFKSFKEIYNNEKDLIYNEGYISVYDSLNEHLMTKINFNDLKDLEYTYNELIDYYDNIKTILIIKDIDETYEILYRHILDAVSFTIFINYYEECIKDVINWKKARDNKILKNIKSHIQLQINNIDDVFYIVNNLPSAYKHRYIPLLKQCHNINIKNLTNFHKFKIDDLF